MPLVETKITTAICDSCGTAVAHASNPSGMLPLEFFFTKKWHILPLGDGQLVEAFCPRCTPVLHRPLTARAAT